MMESLKNTMKLLVKCSFFAIFLTVNPHLAQAQGLPGDCNIGDHISCWLPCLPCPYRPQAQCRQVQVRCKCEQTWFENGQQVPCTPTEQPAARNATQTVQPPLQPPAATECPPGVRRVQCLVNPCDVTSCQAFPNATCLPNYCGGCFSEFYQNGLRVICTPPDGRNVTRVQLTTEPSVTTKSQVELTSMPGRPDGSARGGSVLLTIGQPVQAGVSTSASRRFSSRGRFSLFSSRLQQTTQDRPDSNVTNKVPAASVQAQPAEQGGPEGIARTSAAPAFSSNVSANNQSTTESQRPHLNDVTTPALTSSGVPNVSLPVTNQTDGVVNSSKTDLSSAAACEAGVKQVSCTEDPCMGQTCDVSGAQCRASGCGSCHAEWYLGDNVVQCREACPARMFSARCPVDPCAIQSCHAFPEAVCRTRTCGACRAEWNVAGRRVTHECFSTRSVDECPSGQEPTCKCETCPSNYAASCRIRGCSSSCRLEYFTVNNGREEVVRCRGVFQSL